MKTKKCKCGNEFELDLNNPLRIAMTDTIHCEDCLVKASVLYYRKISSLIPKK